MFSANDQFSAAPFWHNGPAPGASYNFPNNQVTPSKDFRQHSQ